LHITQALVSIHSKTLTQILGNLHPTNIIINMQGELIVIGEASIPG